MLLTTHTDCQKAKYDRKHSLPVVLLAAGTEERVTHVCPTCTYRFKAVTDTIKVCPKCQRGRVIVRA